MRAKDRQWFSPGTCILAGVADGIPWARHSHAAQRWGAPSHNSSPPHPPRHDQLPAPLRPAADPFFLYEREATVQAPTEADMAANTASLAQNGTAWWGCASSQCVASGADVAVLDDVASAEACCRACAARFEGTPVANQTGQPCNAW